MLKDTAEAVLGQYPLQGCFQIKVIYMKMSRDSVLVQNS